MKSKAVIYGKVDPKLVNLAVMARPCKECDDYACELARVVLYAAGYEYAGLNENGLHTWRKP
jgi:hypothetical protein